MTNYDRIVENLAKKLKQKQDSYARKISRVKEAYEKKLVELDPERDEIIRLRVAIKNLDPEFDFDDIKSSDSPELEKTFTKDLIETVKRIGPAELSMIAREFPQIQRSRISTLLTQLSAEGRISKEQHPNNPNRRLWS